jgi:GTPase
MSNLVAIVGRPNVGKSTLFNRLTETREAIIDPTSGVTRDRKYGPVHWGNREFRVVDTGGYISNSDDVFEGDIRKQVHMAIDEADVILFIVDVTTGITDLDEVIANLLRRQKKPVLLVSNKVDTSVKEAASAEFYSLGIANEVYSISANNGYGTGDLLQAIVAQLPEAVSPSDDGIPRIAVVGKPNVGKSTLVNTILGEERTIVNEVAGTTRDAVDSRFSAFGLDFIITDTAGLRRKNKVEENIEFYTMVRTYKAIERSDVCILMIDAADGFSKQDLTIFYQIEKAKKGVVVVVNKWDLIEKDHKTHDEFKKDLIEKLAPFNDVPIIFTSNHTKQRLIKALEMALKVYEDLTKKISTSQLNDYLLEIITATPPPALKGKYIKIKYITQLPSRSPAFAFFCNLPQYIKEPYKRFLENRIRERFEFTGVPIRLYFRKK